MAKNWNITKWCKWSLWKRVQKKWRSLILRAGSRMLRLYIPFEVLATADEEE